MARRSLTIIANAFERERALAQKAQESRQIFWSKQELACLMRLYGAHVANGTWRDYGLSASARLSEPALFSVFRHTHECALYTIEKHLRPYAHYILRDAQGSVLRRAQDIGALARYFERKNLRVVR